MQVKGHTAIVTGGGSGLGAGTARLLAEKGARVALLDVNLAGAEAVAKETGGIAVHCDVANAESGAKAVAAVIETLGIPRILVNCAGIGPAARIVGRDGPQPLEQFARVISINLIGTFNMMRLVAAETQKLDPLEDGERGVILCTASVAAYDGQIGQAAYSASKGGVVGMTLPAAREFARSGIRVVTIAPGIFATPMVQTMPQAVQDSLAAQIPFPSRLGTPQDYAALALHICENTMINGETIRLDGAIRMTPK